LGPQLVAGGRQAAGRPIQYVRYPSEVVFPWCPNGQIGSAVTVEVSGGHGKPEVVANFCRTGDAWAVLGRRCCIAPTQGVLKLQPRPDQIAEAS
jgi:hypothetical protein